MNSLLNYRNICHSCRIASYVHHHQQRSFWTSPQLNIKSHYETLELKPGATHSDIKTAYYRLSMKFHPDKNKGNEDKFKDLSTAYEVLGNPRLRRLYDRGIITHDHPTIHQHSDYDGSGGDVEQSENAKASVRTFDQWSKNHYSETFARSQNERTKRKNQDRIKEKKSSQSGSEGLIWILGLVGLVFAVYSFKYPWDKSKKKS